MSRCVRHRIWHGRHIHWCTRNHCSWDCSSDTVCHVCWGRKIHRSANSWDKGSSYWLTHGWSSIHAHTWWPSWVLRRLFARFSRGTSSTWTISLTSNRSLRCWNVSIVNTGDIMNAWSPSIFVHWVQTNEVLLSMACHLCWRSRNYKVTRYTSPITFPIFVQTEKK